MRPTRLRHLAPIVMCGALGAATAACGDDDGAATGSSAVTSQTTIESIVETAAPTSRPTPATTATTSPPTPESTPTTPSPSTTIDDGWREEAAAICTAVSAELAAQDYASMGWAESVAFWRDLRYRLPSLGQLDLPEHLRTAPSDIPAQLRQADEFLAVAEAAVAAGDDATVQRAVTQYDDLMEHHAALVTVAGVDGCGNSPARAATAALNVPVGSATQVATGHGSVWVSGLYDTSILRIDPDSGEVLATIDIGAEHAKSQPAGERMIVRAADSYVAIDARTNTVVATLLKSDVGPAANRSWAIDGAMWICDGQRLHRYDPATFLATGTVIDLDIDCGQVYATNELVVAWTYNEDVGESGTSAAVFVDPATNQVLATTALPADVNVPIVLDDAVYFPASRGTQNAVVDRATWTVTATPDYGRQIFGSQMAFDGRRIYLIADRVDVIVIDAETYQLIDTIEPVTVFSGPNALAVGPGALWVAGNASGILQRFDIP